MRPALNRRTRSPAEAFGHDCFYYYHLNRHAHFVDRELAAYLSSPARDDVLDQVVPDSGPAAPPVRVPVVLRRASGSATGASMALA
jgi:hypothetical protein